MNKRTIGKLKDHRLWFGYGEGNRDEPRNQTEDLGDDAVKASQYGIKNLQRIVPQLTQWTKEANSDYESLGEIYSQVTQQFGRYLGHVSKNIGSTYKTPKVVEDPGAVYEFIPKAKQAASVAFLNQQLFATPTWLINNEVYSKTGGNPLTIIGNLQDNTLGTLLSATLFNKLIMQEATAGNDAYKMTDLLNDLKKGIWSELSSKKTIDVYRRNLQKSYINNLDNLINPPPAAAPAAGGLAALLGGSSSSNIKRSDIISVIKVHLQSLKNEVNAAKGSIADPMSKYHLQDIAQRIDNALDPKK